MLEATFLKFVRENMTSHMTGLNRKRSGAVKNMEVSSRTVRDIMDRLAYSNPFIDIEEAGSSGQKRKAGESAEDEADRGRVPDDAEEPEAKHSRVKDIASRRAELLRMFEDLCDRAGELQICMKRGKESHEGTCKDTARATESDSARGKIAMLFLSEGHPSSDEDIEILMMMKKWFQCQTTLMTTTATGKRGADLLSEGGVPQIQLRREPLRDG